MTDSHWPDLSDPANQESWETLHLMTQIVGKVRIAREPWLNHSWHVPLYLSPVGLGTGLIPHPIGGFDIELDFVAGEVVVWTSEGRHETLPLASGSIAGFHRDMLAMLDRLGVGTTIHGAPNEIADAIPFAEDTAERPFDIEAARRLWRALLAMDAVFKRFRTGFLGKASPVHFFWGSFDLAVTRFSGRPAPVHPGGVPNFPDEIAREAYSHEVSSAGFWPGNTQSPEPIFYSYAYPEPDGFREADGLPEGARYDENLSEYVLPYGAVRAAADPEAMLLEFLQRTYAAAADSADWDRDSLECELGEPGTVRDHA
ncbi:MAG: DUF5996 family protein [Pseudomonadota bacterium]